MGGLPFACFKNHEVKIGHPGSSIDNLVFTFTLLTRTFCDISFLSVHKPNKYTHKPTHKNIQSTMYILCHTLTLIDWKYNSYVFRLSKHLDF